MSVTSHLAPSALQRLRDCFDSFDEDKDGLISMLDVVKGIAEHGYGGKMPKVKSIIAEYEGPLTELDLEAFLEIFVPRAPAPVISPTQSLFEELDSGGKGIILLEDLMEASEQAGLHFSEQELREMVRRADFTGVGGINYPAFAQVLRKYHKC